MTVAGSLLDRADGCTLLHRGGEADVYEISDNGKKFVLKWYRGGSCYSESVIASLCKNRIDGVYQVLEYGHRDGIPYILCQYVDGVESSAVKRMPVLVALHALRRVTGTLNELAGHGIHHGDLTPSNVMLKADGKSFDTVLIDCGIAGPGALAYAAPERFRGKSPDIKSDLFSLGLLLFRWVSGADLVCPDGGENPFDWFASRMSAIGAQNPVDELYGKGCFSPEEISALSSVWNGLLQGDPQDRLEDFEELDEVLEIAVDRISGGEIALLKKLEEFTKGSLAEKLRQIVPHPEEKAEKCAFPYKKAPCAKKLTSLKVSVLCAFGLILLTVVLVLAFVTKDPGIDEVGSMVLQKSRSLELNSSNERSGNGGDVIIADSSLLRNLPTPETER